jgi:hypothetical protein
MLSIRWVDATDPGTVHTRHSTSGKSTCQKINLSLPENSGIVYMSCVGEGSRIYHCGDTAKDRA